MKQVLVRKGEAFIEDVPAPAVEPGTVLVRVAYSCISAGTETSTLHASGKPIWRRVLEQPELLRKGMGWIRSQGLAQAASNVADRLHAAHPIGYSAAGHVIAAGSGVDRFRPGDLVACAGAQCAFHAEAIRVPVNLVAAAAGVDLADASSVTLGAIALQGVRRAAPTLGEVFVVIGLGILGQLTAQLLKVNGCRVIGIDPDPARLSLASTLGMDQALDADSTDATSQVSRITGGIGADGVIVTAASKSSEVMATAFRMCRKKGRVVLVGDVGLALDRNDIYEKELDFFVSTSYGPGRYDGRYEEQGLDYPVGYVRWTENRNMGEFLRLMAEGRVRVAPLISATYPVDQAHEAYASLQNSTPRPLMVLLRYPDAPSGPLARSVACGALPARVQGRIRLALVGAGSFAKSAHLPNVRSMPERYELRTVVSRSGHNAVAAAQRFGAVNASTDFDAILGDPDIDALIIATRHHLHADMARLALLAGKHVLVEKPLALTPADLQQIAALYATGAPTRPMLLTGYNRRFSPYTRRIQEIIAKRANPMILCYRMNAGHIETGHWVHGAQGGGRNIGEACHIYDLFTALTGSKVLGVSAQGLRPATDHCRADDNFVATMSFADGSVASLVYTALGSAEHPKERMDIYVDGMVLTLDDYKSLQISGSKVRGMSTARAEKGQLQELEAFSDALRSGAWPIAWWEQQQACEIAFRVQDFLVGSGLSSPNVMKAPP